MDSYATKARVGGQGRMAAWQPARQSGCCGLASGRQRTLRVPREAAYGVSQCDWLEPGAGRPSGQRLPLAIG
jgi:hypothetical protein